MKNLLIFVFTFCTVISYGQKETNQIERKGFVYIDDRKIQIVINP